MAHPKHRKQHTQQRILHAAARLFAHKGFNATSIDDVMRDCGLTRGGFYAHFRSKAQLHQEALTQTRPDSRPGELLSASDAAALSPWSSLAKDVGSATPEVRQNYARTLELLRRQLRLELRGEFRGDAAESSQGDEAVLATTAMLIGALAVAQSVDDAGLVTDMAEACRKAARALRDEVLDDPRPIFFWSLPGLPLH